MSAPVVVELGGVARELRYDLNALATLKQKHGINLLDPTPGIEFDNDPATLRAIIWVGLLHKDRTVTEDDVGAWVGIAEIVPIATKVAEALAAGLHAEVSAERAGP